MAKDHREIVANSERLDENSQHIGDSWERNNIEFEKSNTLIGKMGNSFQGLVKSAKEVTGLFADATWGLTLADAAKNAWKLNNSMTALSAQMGKGAKGVKELENSVTGMMKSIGSSFADAKQIVESLAEAKYAGDLTDAAKSIDMYSRATGVTLATSVQFTDQLSKQAGMTTKATSALMAGMANVQQKIGISKNGMEALSNSIIDMSVNMAAFGKSSDEIKAAAVKTTSLVGAMEKVGVAAQDTLNLIDRITDPERIEDNILLYSQLGISMNDAMSGNIEVTDGMLQELGQKVKDMGPIAGNSFARSMGMSYKELTKMSTLSEQISADVAESANVTEDQALEKLNELMSNAEGFGKKVGNFFNQLKGHLMGLGPILLTLGGVLGIIWKNRGSKQASIFSEGAGGSLGGGKAGSSLASRAGAFFGNIKGSLGGGGGGFAESGAQILSDSKRSGMERNLAILEGLNSKIADNPDDAKSSRLREDLAKRMGIGSANELSDFSTNKSAYEKRTKILNDEKKAREGQHSIQKKINEILEMRSKEINPGLKKSLDKQLDSLNDQLLVQVQAEKVAIKEGNLLKDKADSYEKIKNKLEDITKVERKSGLVGMLQGGANRIKAGVGSWKNDIISSRLESGKRTTGFIGKVGVAKDMTKSVLGGPAGKILKFGGVFAGAIGLLAKALPGIMENLKPVFEKIMPIMTDLLSKLAKALLPPILKILSGLLRITMPLVGLLTGLLAKIPGVKKIFGPINDAVHSIGSPEFLDGLNDAADNIANSNTDLTKSVEKNNDIMTGEEGGAIISVSGGSARFSNGGGTTISGDSALTDDERNERAKNDSNNKKNFEEMQGQSESLNTSNNLLSVLVDEVKKLSNILKNPAIVSPHEVTAPGEG